MLGSQTVKRLDLANLRDIRRGALTGNCPSVVSDGYGTKASHQNHVISLISYGKRMTVPLVNQRS